jgi:hypothetical protein
VVLNFTDLSTFAMRLPGILMFFISVVCIWKTMELLDKTHIRGLWFLFFAVISPVYIFLFRIGMDCNLLLAMTGIFFYFLIKAVQSEKKLDFAMAGVSAGILLYTYALSYLVLLMFLAIYFIYLLWVKKIRFTNVLWFAVPLGILAMPLVMVQLINMFDLEEMHIGVLTLTKLRKYRVTAINPSHISFKSIKRCLKVIFFNDMWAYNSISEFGNTYMISIPFIMIGLIRCIVNSAKSIHRREWSVDIIYVIWFLLFLIEGFMIASNVNRLNGIFIAETYFQVEGVISFIHFFSKDRVRRTITAIIIAVYFIFFVRFSVYYFGGEYQNDYEPLSWFDYSLTEPLDYLNQLDEYRDRTTYIGDLCQGYIQFLVATETSPYDYNAYNQNGVSEDSNSKTRKNFSLEYENYIFELPDVVINDANFIIEGNDENWRERLLAEGFTEHVLEHYSVYIYEGENQE